MQDRGKLSWRIEIGEGYNLHQMLYLRDVLRLDGASRHRVGPLIGAVPDFSNLISDLSRVEVFEWWAEWWNRMLSSQRQTLPVEATQTERRNKHIGEMEIRNSPDFSLVNDPTELRGAFNQVTRSFNSWWFGPGSIAIAPRNGSPWNLPGISGGLIDLHRGDDVLQEVTNELETRLGRRLPPFSLTIEVLSVVSPSIIVQDSRFAVVSSELLTDQLRYRNWLGAMIERLVEMF